MEGIDELEPRLARAMRAGDFDPPQREWRLVERWLVFLFVMSVLVISGLALAIAALPLR
jgi:hypothetical protein